MTAGTTVAAGATALCPHVTRVLAPNAGPMTLDGTNAWVLRDGPDRPALVVDPGPLDKGHLATLAALGPVATILLTHGHADHSEGAARLAELTGAPVRALDPAYRLGGEGLADGDVVTAGELALHVLATPGHTADSLCFTMEEGCQTGGSAVLTGDTVLGRGTTVVAHPDGRLADYLRSLRRLRELGSASLLPGHGPVLPEAGAAAEAYLAHREQRLAQVRDALAAGASTASEVVASVYADIDKALWPAAELSVRAQIEYLRTS
ncbi:MAG: MBL fold metallo-hydrolase [Actinomycetota bacterium]|nr:MBL fold metallo-hydrolase [Actinomycetota bacterium]